MYIPKKVAGRITKSIKKFQRILRTAKKRDINESDTVAVITDMLSEIFGYDKYTEITSELAIHGTFCDLAIKVDKKFTFLIECKAIGLDLKENHLRQAVNYGATKGIQWVILTNGMQWQLHHILFEKPISHEHVFTIQFDALTSRKDADIESLYLLSKEGVQRGSREDYYERVQNVNRFIIGNLILQDDVIKTIRRDLRRFADGAKVEASEIYDIIEKEVLKREVIEGEEADKARARLKRHFRKSIKHKSASAVVKKDTIAPQKTISVTEQLLREAEA